VKTFAALLEKMMIPTGYILMFDYFSS